jgi:hypothetical protein
MHEVPDKITLTFSKDGHKLLFIDNKVQVLKEKKLISRDIRKCLLGVCFIDPSQLLGDADEEIQTVRSNYKILHFEEVALAEY